MKTLFAVLLAALLAGCTSMGQMTAQFDPTKPRSVFVEGFGDLDGYRELYDYAGIALARRGYDAVPDPDKATYRLRSSLQWSLSRIYLASRLVDSTTGQVVYFGECKNRGFGTMLSSSRAMADCFADALNELQ